MSKIWPPAKKLFLGSQSSRREFLGGFRNLVAYASIPQWLRSKVALAQESESETYTPQRKLIWINMRGGWDILEVLDPKVSSTAGIDMSFAWGQAHRLRGASDDVRLGRWMPLTAGIGQDLLLIRGLAMGTTSHMAGNVYMETGILSNSGRVNAASIPAIVASESGATIPVIQLNGGSEAMTDRGLLKPVSVVRASNLELYQQMYPQDEEEKSRKIALLDYLKTSIEEFQGQVGTHDRLSELAAAEDKIRVQFENDVGQRLETNTEDLLPFTTGAPQGLNRGLAQSFALATKLIKNDVITCVNLGIGGFDTHSNQSASLVRTLGNVDYLLSTMVAELRAAGTLDETLIVVYSDFGRTPKINNSNGRDHWPVGGAMLIGGGIDGGRAVGATDDALRALSVDLATGQTNTEGTQLSPIHLGGSVLELTLGSDYLRYRPYLESVPAITRLRSG